MSNKNFEKVKNLKEEWLVYNPTANTYQPYGIKGSTFEQNAISFYIDTKKNRHFKLLIACEAKSTLLVENKVVDFFPEKGPYLLGIDSLGKKWGKDSLFITLYHPSLSVSNLKTHIVNYNNRLDNNFLAKNFTVNPRLHHSKKDFFVLGLLALMAFLAYTVYSYPRVISDYFKLNSMLSVRARDEPLFKSRFLSKANLFVLIQYSLIASFIMVILSGFVSNGSIIFNYLNVGSIGMAFFQWLKAFVIILMAMVGKHMLIYGFTLLYKQPSLKNLHYFNYLRLSIIMCFIMLVAITAIYLALNVGTSETYQKLVYFLLFVFGIRLLIIFFKLFNLSNLRTFYLFSYLCATEIVPFVLVIKIFL